MGLNVRWLLTLVALLLFLLLYNEFIVYYLVILQCTWPQLINDGNPQHEPLKAVFLADTHLLGTKEGHWFDKFRREWAMERAFQTMLSVHSPDVVFVLGDLFDEGKWCSDAEFENYFLRFERMFRHSDHTDLQVVVGNHDIGFHYMVDDKKHRRFSQHFGAPSVRMLSIRGNVFVLLNSIAFEGDRCTMCKEAESQLQDITLKLDCSKITSPSKACDKVETFPYSKPIILQHFPLYRPSDANCTGSDSAPANEKNKRFLQKTDCLSKKATDKLLTTLHPRLAVTAHTHHFCYTEHLTGSVPEWTIPSFSWRNRNDPSFLLVQLTPDDQAITKCMMPQESTVIVVYVVGVILILVWCVWGLVSRRNIQRTRYSKLH